MKRTHQPSRLLTPQETQIARLAADFSTPALKSEAGRPGSGRRLDNPGI
jgi:hypothetical protein